MYPKNCDNDKKFWPNKWILIKINTLKSYFPKMTPLSEQKIYDYLWFYQQWLPYFLLEKGTQNMAYPIPAYMVGTPRVYLIL